MHPAYSDMMTARVDAAVRSARAAMHINHPGLKGHLREIVILELLRPLLPSDIGVGSGLIVTIDGKSSRQQDVVIYDRSVVPPLVMESAYGLFPIESVVYALEIKSPLTREDLASTHAAMRDLLALECAAGLCPLRIPGYQVVRPAVLAFGTDLEPGGKGEVERYEQVRGAEATSIAVICVVGSGLWWWQTPPGVWRSGRSEPERQEHEEVLALLSGILNTYSRVVASRPRPPLERYLLPDDALSSPGPPTVTGHLAAP